jgi:hypothetical protein
MSEEPSVGMRKLSIKNSIANSTQKLADLKARGWVKTGSKDVRGSVKSAKALQCNKFRKN